MTTDENVLLKSMTFYVKDAHGICEVIFVCVTVYVMYYVIAKCFILL